jgi:hypothetical protein
MYQDIYYIPKRSGTLADQLVAYGTALVLQALLKQLPERPYDMVPCRVRIEDRGACYVIALPEPIREEYLTQSRLPHDLARPVVRVARPKEGANPPRTPKPEKQPLPQTARPIDYNGIWDGIRKANAIVEAHRAVNNRASRDEIDELRRQHQTEPRDRDVALLIGDYRMQVEQIHNQAVAQWVRTLDAGYQAVNLRTMLTLFATPHADITAIAKQWAKEVKLEGIKPHLTASQVFNPSMGKGQNQPKANALAMGNEDQFWLLEYLKAVGLFAAAAPRAFSDQGMRKTYVLMPVNIELDQHDQIFRRFKRTLDGASPTPIKADVLTSLDYADAYLSYSRAAKLADPDAEIDFHPRNTVRGFAVAGYVLLSQNSFTMINLSSLGLPPWLDTSVRTSNDAAAVQAVVAEHQAIIRPLNEAFQEQNYLLDTYRDFLAGRTEALFVFCAAYGEHVVRTLPENQRIRQMSIPALDQIIRRIGMPEVDPLDFVSTSGRHAGFHKIAYAIRHSTTIPQRQNANAKKGQGQKSLYDVRYGLGNNLRRKTDSASDFMEALTEFLHLYNAETVQVYENTGEQRRKQVSIGDLDDILVLVGAYGPRLICNMLVAYGYASSGLARAEEGDPVESAVTSEDDAGSSGT